jgi:hypothetical protein
MAWKMKGVWYEGCASEGHCSMFFGRDMEAPCKSFQVFQIKEGQINNVDVGGILVITVADLFSGKFSDLMAKGGEGGIYISETATEEQRKVLEPFFVNNVPGWFMVRKPLGVRFVDIKLSKEDNTYHITMPYGELKASLTVGGDGKNPQRLENSLFSMILPDIKICNTHFWKYHDFGKNWEFVNRSGVMADFDLHGE